jgi:hypothetical protein
MSDPNRSAYFVHLIFVLMSAIVILTSFVLKADDRTGILIPGSTRSMPPMCTSRVIFGMDCPGCGMTRAFIAISHGRFARAWELNRASFLVYAFVLVQIPWHTLQAIRVRRGRPPIDWFAIYFIPLGLAMVLVLNWMLRMAGW